MGPYPFALAAALVSGLLAGLALGTVRLTRLSLGWWRALRARFRPATDELDERTEPPLPADPHGPPGPFPRAHGAVLCATLVAVLLLATALIAERAPLPAAAAPAGLAWSEA